ncbi:MAG: polymerase X family protein [Candidatus Collierbacteria bacterium GW2011_GWA2_42_17]|uniref:Polymerase X family protein n=1 Tax=Candidatus Collierbacteria bacterium GW2011_GWA2_42_17 TaxID=1618378 RepID=A0A0G0Z0X0_9BACT|nr:MAG: polymerase X family protein [Candidatus Collierbacteria bacterium GW2011_GWA2_42_17]
MTINQETAQLLKRVAAVLRVKEGDTFRYKAYVNASVAIDNLSDSIFEVWKRGELDTVPGLGESLSRYLNEYFSTGRVRHFESLFKKVPSGMFPLMTIRGIGPITAYKISKKFHLNDPEKTLTELKEILISEKLTKIQGFKEKTISKIKKALDIQSFGKGRLPLYEALPVAEDFINYLLKSKAVSKAEPLGSLRRKHVKMTNGLEVDLKISLPNSWGSILQHYTGGKLHNIHLRSLAKEKGLSLSEYGITQNGKLNRFTSEAKFYQFIGLEYIPPEIRENTGEIELAIKHQIPTLLEIKDIKGDLHTHSDFSFQSSHDIGISPLSQLLNTATKNDYEYIGISDHNPKFQGLTEKQKIAIILNRKKYLLSQYRTYEKDVKSRVPKLLIGMEVDIRPDGSLALSDKAMESLDYVIASIHGSFDLTEEANTRRIQKALSHPKVKILGHPTNRTINGREPISANWEKIFTYCAQNKKIIEINASPNRLDLPDDLIKQALTKKVKLIINTDSHEVSQMENMKYGVWQARRGYAQKSDIINTLPFKDLRLVLEL